MEQCHPYYSDWCGFSCTLSINSNEQVTLALRENESHSTSVPWERLLTSAVDTTLHSFPFCAEMFDRRVYKIDHNMFYFGMS